jgi:rhodanese-related sulfurtransferase
MKKILFLILAVTIFHSAHGQADTLGYISLKPTEFKKAMENSKDFLLIDVREFFEYKKSRIKGAVNIPASGNMDIAADTIRKGKDLFLYCTSGFRSKKATKHFVGKGFAGIYSLEGGISGWRKEGLGVERKRIGRRGVSSVER